MTPFVARAVAAGGPGLLCIPGMELTTYYGHANALGIPDWIDWRVARPEGALELPGEAEAGEPDPGLVTGTMAAAAAEVHRLGGTFVINHPRATGYPYCTGCRWEFGDQSADYADLLEVWNGPWVRAYPGAASRTWKPWPCGTPGSTPGGASPPSPGATATSRPGAPIPWPHLRLRRP